MEEIKGTPIGLWPGVLKADNTNKQERWTAVNFTFSKTSEIDYKTQFKKIIKEWQKSEKTPVEIEKYVKHLLEEFKEMGGQHPLFITYLYFKQSQPSVAIYLRESFSLPATQDLQVVIIEIIQDKPYIEAKVFEHDKEYITSCGEPFEWDPPSTQDVLKFREALNKDPFLEKGFKLRYPEPKDVNFLYTLIYDQVQPVISKIPKSSRTPKKMAEVLKGLCDNIDITRWAERVKVTRSETEICKVTEVTDNEIKKWSKYTEPSDIAENIVASLIDKSQHTVKKILKEARSKRKA